MTNDADGVTAEDLESLKSVDYAKGIAVFSSKDYNGFDFVYPMPKQENGEMIVSVKFCASFIRKY